MLLMPELGWEGMETGWRAGNEIRLGLVGRMDGVGTGHVSALGSLAAVAARNPFRVERWLRQLPFLVLPTGLPAGSLASAFSSYFAFH
jgi:hypothetical protein